VARSPPGCIRSHKDSHANTIRATTMLATCTCTCTGTCACACTAAAYSTRSLADGLVCTAGEPRPRRCACHSAHTEQGTCTHGHVGLVTLSIGWGADQVVPPSARLCVAYCAPCVVCRTRSGRCVRQHVCVRASGQYVRECMRARGTIGCHHPAVRVVPRVRQEDAARPELHLPTPSATMPGSRPHAEPNRHDSVGCNRQ
jgi:hypothetical protein